MDIVKMRVKMRVKTSLETRSKIRMKIEWNILKLMERSHILYLIILIILIGATHAL